MLERRIDLTGSSTVLLGGLCLLLAALDVAVPILLRSLAAVLDVEDPLQGMREAFSAGAATSAWVNAVFGLSLIVIGVGVSRRSRWAHRALEAACWASIAVLAVLTRPTLAPFFALADKGEGTGVAMLVVSALLVLAQVAAVIWFLRFWRKPEVKQAFRQET